MTDVIDKVLMKSTDEAFWAELNQQWAQAKEEKTDARYVIMDKNESLIKVMVTDARLTGKTKINC